MTGWAGEAEKLSKKAGNLDRLSWRNGKAVKISLAIQTGKSYKLSEL